MTTFLHEELLPAKELAGKLRRSYHFVLQMKRRGFEMPGGTATLTEAREFLRANPQPFKKTRPGFTQ
jgi:hypothetical protein